SPERRGNQCNRTRAKLSDKGITGRYGINKKKIRFLKADFSIYFLSNSLQSVGCKICPSVNFTELFLNRSPVSSYSPIPSISFPSFFRNHISRVDCVPSAVKL